MSLPCDRAFPLVVQVNSSAKVSEIIGYICWAYQKEGRKPELTGNVEDYALYMGEESAQNLRKKNKRQKYNVSFFSFSAEPDGTIEFEFQSLDPKEPLSKFGFNLLGLVDTRTLAKKTLRPEEKIISVTFPDGTFSLIEIETREISLKQVCKPIGEKQNNILIFPLFFYFFTRTAYGSSFQPPEAFQS